MTDLLFGTVSILAALVVGFWYWRYVWTWLRQTRPGIGLGREAGQIETAWPERAQMREQQAMQIDIV